MNDTYTGAISLSIFGESHGPAVGATLSGLAAGVPVDEAYIAREMDKRRAAGRLSTKRTEPDRVHFLSGVYKGFTTGTAVTLVIENTNTRSEDYEKTQDLLRPGHADWTAHLKYRGFQDARGGEANDALRMHAGRTVSTTNHNGGVNGGITNGMPLVFRTVVKPTASIYQVQQTVDWAAKRDATLLIHGRHDPCIAHRARAVQDAVTALAVADLCAQHFGKDWQVAQAWNMG